MTEERTAAIVGVYTTEQSRTTERPGLSFALEALRGARHPHP